MSAMMSKAGPNPWDMWGQLFTRVIGKRLCSMLMEQRVNFHYALHGFHAISMRGWDAHAALQHTDEPVTLVFCAQSQSCETRNNGMKGRADKWLCCIIILAVLTQLPCKGDLPSTNLKSLPCEDVTGGCVFWVLSFPWGICIRRNTWLTKV